MLACTGRQNWSNSHPSACHSPTRKWKGPENARQCGMPKVKHTQKGPSAIITRGCFRVLEGEARWQQGEEQASGLSRQKLIPEVCHGLGISQNYLTC